jgi:hypothetical protein
MGILLLRMAGLLLLAAPASAQPATCPPELATVDIIDHDFSVSFCELCDVGTVRIVVDNPLGPPDDVDFSEIVVTEDLLASGLTYVPGTTTFSGSNITLPPVVEPAVSGPNGSVLTWTLDPGFTMPALPGPPGSRAQFVIEFDVRRHPAVGDEGLVTADRDIDIATAGLPAPEPCRSASRSPPS